MNNNVSYNYEEISLSNYDNIAGIDEVGVGSLVGPIIIALVILPKNFKSSIIKDSKSLSETQRNLAYDLIKENAKVAIIKTVYQEDIYKYNNLTSTLNAMKEIILDSKIIPDVVLIDGEKIPELNNKNIKIINLIKGDSISLNIAAASIIAKVERDSLMKKLHNFFPFYNWYSNKGYPSQEHVKAILSNGICFLHRKNYEPIKSLIQNNNSLDIKNKIRKKYKI